MTTLGIQSPREDRTRSKSTPNRKAVQLESEWTDGTISSTYDNDSNSSSSKSSRIITIDESLLDSPPNSRPTSPRTQRNGYSTPRATNRRNGNMTPTIQDGYSTPKRLELDVSIMVQQQKILSEQLEKLQRATAASEKLRQEELVLMSQKKCCQCNIY